MKTTVLIPAYGRDYTSKAAVAADLYADKDFIISDMSERWNGAYVNGKQLLEAGYDQVEIRYNKLRKLTMVKIK